jgi:hypothetical protein
MSIAMFIFKCRCLSNILTCDLLACGLGKKCRARQASSRGRSIDLIDETFIEGDVDPHRAPDITQQRHGKQYGSCCQCLSYIFVTKNVIEHACRRHRSTSALQCFYVLTQCRCRIRGGFCQGISCRETSFHIRKPDSERAVGILLDDRYILSCHARIFLHYSKVLCGSPRQRSSSPPSRQLIDTSHKSDRQILARVRDGDERLPIRVLERMVVAAHAVENPAILLQHPDQLPAVSFHVATSSRAAGNSCGKFLARPWRWPQSAGGAYSSDRVYKYTHQENVVKL